MKKFLIAAMTAAMAATIQAAGAKGSCEAKADSISVGASKSVKLVDEYDPDWKETYGSGAYYLAVTLKKGEAYTLYTQGGNADVIDCYAYPREATDAEYDRGIYEPMAGFDDGAEQGGKYVQWLYAEDWDEEDQASWKFFIYLSGEIGETTTVTLLKGIQSYVAEGMEENPRRISFSTTEQTFNGRLTEEESYYFVASLTKGRKYLVRTTGGTAGMPHELMVDSESVMVTDDPDYAGDAYNGAKIVVADANTTARFVVSGGSAGAAFGLKYKMIGARGIASHPYGELTAGAPVEFRPGREVADKEYYDDIIDECLYRVQLTKGERWVFDATGADRAIDMRLYDSKGNTIANGAVNGGEYDQRIGYEATASGYYYIGVCDPKLTVEDAVVCATTRLTARKVENRDGEESLAMVPAKADDDPLEEGAVSGPYALDEQTWHQTLSIGARKGLTYKAALNYVDPAAPDRWFNYELFTRSGTRESIIRSGVLKQDSTIEFAATSSTTYYIRLSAYAGMGIDSPAFNIHSIAISTTGEDLGILTVSIHGAPNATWYLDRETSTTYPSGASVMIAGSHTVNFSRANGFSAPAGQTVTVAPGKEPTVVEGYYTDTADPADDQTSGSGTVDGKRVTYKATAWTLKNTESGFDRTLWKNDPADNYLIDGKDGYFYDFALTGVTGDAMISITNATPYGDNGGIFALAVTGSISRLVLPTAKTKYVLVVSHLNDPAEDGCYHLSGKFANVGAIKFSQTAVSVKEDAANVKLTLNRTAKDGKVRVKYGTVAGTAKPGEDYIAQSGVIEWANGDNKAKDIVIKLVPDLVATYEGANRQFSVKIEPMPEDERDDDEYEAAFTVDSKTGVTLDTATITLTETTKANAGTVQIDCVTPKKPEYAVVAGSKLSLPLARINGADGDIEVKVDASAIGGGTPTVSWKDGEADIKTLEFAIPTDGKDYKASKKVTIRLSATSKTKPNFAATSVSVTVMNEKFAKTAADWAKALPKNGGVSAKEGKTGTWFQMADGSLTNFTGTGALTFTISGPCTFKYTVDGADMSATAAVGKSVTVTIPSGARSVTYEYVYNEGEFVRLPQGVKHGYEKPVADGTRKVKVAAGKLPDGIKLEQDRTTKEWFVRGVPTKAGLYCADLSDVTNSRDPQALDRLAFEVVEAGLSVGTFNGILTEDGSALTNGFAAVGTLNLTVTSAGKITAKATVGGSTYSFSDTGFDSADTETEPGEFLVDMELATRVGKETVTNEIEVVVVEGATNDVVALGRAAGAVTLRLGDVEYRCDLYRDNTKNAAYLAAMTEFVGYYTVALPIMAPEYGKPQGNGYLTLTIDDKGKSKVSGKLADGSSVSCSLLPALVGDLTAPGGCELLVPVFTAKKPSVFGGVMKIRLTDAGEGETVPTVDSTETLVWANDNIALTYYGDEGWKYDLAPTGGWYDTVVNLQTYFLNCDFSADAGSTDDLAPEMLAQGYSFVAGAMPTGQSLEFAGNNLAVTGTNVSGLKVSFKRATGVLTGSFDLLSEGTDSRGKTVQKKISGFKHEGIVLLARDLFSPLASETLSAGYYLAPGVTSAASKKKFTGSYQFNVIIEDKGDIDHWADDWGEDIDE